jgi:hypothetical protein
MHRMYVCSAHGHLRVYRYHHDFVGWSFEQPEVDLIVWIPELTLWYLITVTVTVDLSEISAVFKL